MGSITRAVNFQNIPDELKAKKRWLLWRYELRDEKWTKVPYQPNGQRAQSNNPDTWETFESVIPDFLRFDGIGIMLGDGLSGTDLDHHVENGRLDDFASDIVHQLNSYTEFTPSDEGAHVLTWGSLPPGGRKNSKAGVEMYDSGRFFTVTGWHVPGTPCTVEKRTAELAQVHRQVFGDPGKTKPPKPTEPNNLEDQEVIERALEAANGDKFSRLWNGDISGYSSQSEADLALATILAFWTGNETSRIDKLFRQSGLMRDKWNEKHSGTGETYGEMTCRKAVQSQSETYHPKDRVYEDYAAQVRSKKTLEDGSSNQDEEQPAQDDEPEWVDPWESPFTLVDAFSPRPPLKYLADGLLRESSLNMIFGAPGGMKTLLQLDLCLHVAAGLDWLPPAPWQPGGKAFKVAQAPAMYIDFDNGDYDMHERIEAMARFLALPRDIPFFYYSFPSGGLDAGDGKHMAFLARRILTFNVKLVAVDNLGIVKGKADENSDQMVPVMNNFRRVVEDTGAAIVLIHHQRKSNGLKERTGESIRGHSSIEAALNLALAVNREEYSETIGIRQAKARGGQILPFSAAFTYTHKPGTKILDTAAFYGLMTDDTQSDSAIDKAIIAALVDVRPEKLNQGKLANAARERLTDVGIGRIRGRIRRLAATREILSEPGRLHNEELYSVM